MESMLFRTEERLLVEERFLSDVLYELMEGACGVLMGSASHVALHPSELFYQTFLVIDTLRCKSPDKGVAYCQVLLWSELQGDFRQALRHRGSGADAEAQAVAEETGLAIGCVLQAAAELLVRAGGEGLSAASALKRQIQCHAPMAVSRLDKAFRGVFRTLDEEALDEAIRKYMRLEEMYSEEINEMLDGLELEPADSVGRKEESPGGEPVAAGSHVRIAPRMKTSVLVVLNAMFRASWFVDEKGGELKNRDVALNDILHHAFGIDKATAVSQTVYPSNNPNVMGKNELLLRHLLDEDVMEEYIRELQEELLDAYREEK